MTIFRPKGLGSLDELRKIKERHDGAIRDIVGSTVGALFLIWAAFATNTLALIPIALIAWVAAFLFFRRKMHPLGITVLRTDPWANILLGDAPKGTVRTHRFSPANTQMAAKVERSALSVEGIREAYFMKHSTEGLSTLIPYILVLSVAPDRPANDIVTDLIANSSIVRNRGVTIMPLLPDEGFLSRVREIHKGFYSARET